MRIKVKKRKIRTQRKIKIQREKDKEIRREEKKSRERNNKRRIHTKRVKFHLNGYKTFAYTSDRYSESLQAKSFHHT